MIDDIDLDKAKASIPQSSSTKLADMVVCYRYLGLHKDISMLAMEELGRRRGAGDTFDFEKHIETQLATLPKLGIKERDLSSFFGTIQRIIRRS